MGFLTATVGGLWLGFCVHPPNPTPLCPLLQDHTHNNGVPAEPLLDLLWLLLLQRADVHPAAAAHLLGRTHRAHGHQVPARQRRNQCLLSPPSPQHLPSPTNQNSLGCLFFFAGHRGGREERQGRDGVGRGWRQRRQTEDKTHKRSRAERTHPPQQQPQQKGLSGDSEMMGWRLSEESEWLSRVEPPPSLASQRVEPVQREPHVSTNTKF